MLVWVNTVMGLVLGSLTSKEALKRVFGGVW